MMATVNERTMRRIEREQRRGERRAARELRRAEAKHVVHVSNIMPAAVGKGESR